MLVDLDAAKGCDQTFGFDRFEKERDERLSHHDKLFSNVNPASGFSKQAVHTLERSVTQHKAHSIFFTKFAEVRKSESGGSVEADISISWGGSEPPTWSASGNVEVHDGNGNHVGGSIDYNSDDNRTNITASGGHDED